MRLIVADSIAIPGVSGAVSSLARLGLSIDRISIHARTGVRTETTTNTTTNYNK